MGGIPRAAFVAGRNRVPSEPTTEPIAEWVAVLRGGERLASRTVEGRGDYRSTAASTVAFGEAVLALRNGEDSRAGVFAPEELFTLEDVRPAFELQGIRIVER